MTSAVSTEEKNKKFNEASAAQKRVMIAEEVLWLLDTKKVAAGENVYFSPRGKKELFQGDTQDLQEFVSGLPMGVQACCVCAVGAMFLALASLHGGLRVDTTTWEVSPGAGAEGLFPMGPLIRMNGIGMKRILESFFAHPELSGIENAFEHRFTFKPLGVLDPIPEERLCTVMQNVIDNEGYFRPPPEWSAKEEVL